MSLTHPITRAQRAHIAIISNTPAGFPCMSRCHPVRGGFASSRPPRAGALFLSALAIPCGSLSLGPTAHLNASRSLSQPKMNHPRLPVMCRRAAISTQESLCL